MEVDGRVNVTDNEDQNCIFCEPCEEDGQTVKADGLCRECVQHMCNTCFKHHLKGKFCKGHALIDVEKSVANISGVIQNIEICIDHGERIKFYCQQHESVGCGECMVFHHNGCKIDSIKDLAEDFKTEKKLEEILKQLSDIDETTTSNSSMLDKASTQAKERLQNVERKIKAFRSDIDEAVAKAEKTLLDEVETRRKGAESILSGLDARNKASKSEVETMMKMLNSELYSETALIINTVNIKPKVSVLKSEVNDVKSKVEIEQVDFQPNEEMRRIASTVISLGSLSTVTGTTGTHVVTQVVTADQYSEASSKRVSEDVDQTSPSKLRIALDKNICRFLQKSLKYKVIVESGIESQNGRIIWGTDDSDTVTIQRTSASNQNEIQNWEESCRKFVLDVCKSLEARTVCFSEDRWQEVKERLEMIIIEDPQEALVILKRHTFVVVGNLLVVRMIFNKYRKLQL